MDKTIRLSCVFVSCLATSKVVRAIGYNDVNYSDCYLVASAVLAVYVVPLFDRVV